MSEWQLIETADLPAFDQTKWFKDGPRVLLCGVAGGTVIGSYGYTQTGKGRWRANGYNVCPTHWMPLPPRPETSHE